MSNVARGIRDALAPEVDAHTSSFLGRRWGGMSGPVWSLAVWYVAMAAIMLLNVIVLSLQGEPWGGPLAAALWWSLGGAVLVLLRDRTPGWLVHLLLDTGIVIICWVSVTAANEIRAAGQMMFVVIPAVYAATWFGRQQMAAHLLLLVSLSGAAVLARGVVPDSGRIWVLVMGVSIGLAYFVNALVRHLNQQATIDPVTGLMNRAGLEAVAQSLASRGANGLERTVVVMDLDGFKAINDRGGHAAGDDILRTVGAVMRAQLRPSDTIARTGGDEFVLLLMRTDVGQTEQIVERLVHAMPVSCSYGITNWPLTELFAAPINRADAAMYDHKRAKRSATDDLGFR